MMTLACPSCREQFGLPPSLSGKPFTCLACRATTVVPRPEEIHRSEPTVGDTPLALVPCPGCARVLRLAPDKARGWAACSSCSLVFFTYRLPPTPPLPLGDEPPAPAYEVAEAVEVEAEEAEEVVEDSRAAELLLDRRRERRRSKRRWRLAAAIWAAVVLCSVLVAVLGVRRGAGRRPDAPGAAGRSGATSAASTRFTTARDIILHFKAQGFVTSDVPTGFQGRPAWDLHGPNGRWVILIEYETELDADAFLKALPYGRFALYIASDEHADFLRQLYHSLTGLDMETGKHHPGPMPPPRRW